MDSDDQQAFGPFGVHSGNSRLVAESGLSGTDVAELVAGLCRRLNAAGVAMDRGGCSIITLHPQIVSQEVTWRADDDTATVRYYTPNLMENSDNRRGPYFDLALNRPRCKRFRLDGWGQERKFHCWRGSVPKYAEYWGFFYSTRGWGVSPFQRLATVDGLCRPFAAMILQTLVGGSRVRGKACPSKGGQVSPPQSPHLVVQVDKKVIEVLDADKAKPRKFHVSYHVEGNGQSSGESHHVDPAVRCGRRQGKASQ